MKKETYIFFMLTKGKKNETGKIGKKDKKVIGRIKLPVNTRKRLFCNKNQSSKVLQESKSR